MSLIAKESAGGGYFMPEPGMHAARCYGVVDIGTQDGLYGPKSQVIIMWVLPECLHTYDETKGPEAATLSKFLGTVLAPKSHIQPLLESWRGRPFTDEEKRGFNLINVLDKPCLVNIIHESRNDKMRAVISSVSPPMKGQEIAESPIPVVSYDIDDRTGGAFAELPEWIQRKIAESEEFKNDGLAVSNVGETPPATTGFQGATGASEEDIPF